MNPVSVIIVNYNGGPLLTECVRSVLASSVPVEVIVSDNGSTDHSLIELRLAEGGDTRLRIIENPTNLGFARANNIGLAEAKGDYLLFLNPDCIVQPDTLARMVEVFEQEATLGIAGCLIRNTDGSEQGGCRRRIPSPWRTFVRLSGLSRLMGQHERFESYIQTSQPLPAGPAEIEAISGAFMMVRRTALEAIGPLDEGYFMHCEDLDWCQRFRLGGWKVMFVPHVEILHVGGVSSATCPIRVEYYKHVGIIRFYRKFYSQGLSGLLFLVTLPGIFFHFLGSSFRRLLGKLGLLHLRQPLIEARELVGTRQSPPVKPGRDNQRQRVLVTGATSLIGDYLLPALINAGYEVHAISRNPPEYGQHPDLHWHRMDIEKEAPLSLEADILIHLAPLATLPPVLDRVIPSRLRRVIGFGSTSLFTKMESSLAKERELAEGLQQAEERIAAMCKAQGVDWTIFRPTLVYHLGRDKNVTTIAQFLGKFRFFPLVNGSQGLRQPVHAEDLAQATLKVIDNPRSFAKIYDLSGGEVLSYREMVTRTARALGIRPLVIDIPLPLLKGVIACIALLPRFRHLNTEMATRINRDMCFEHEAATRDFGFQPRPFMEHPHSLRR